MREFLLLVIGRAPILIPQVRASVCPISPSARWAWRIVFVALLLAFIPTLAHAGTFVQFGPQQYVRTDTAPSVSKTTFNAIDPTITFTMRIDSSGVSSAIITLNGIQIFKESDFNARVTLLTKEVKLKSTN